MHSVEIDRHLYWANFEIKQIDVKKDYTIKSVTIDDGCEILKKSPIKNKRQVIRNQVNSKIGLHILNSLKKNYEK